MFWIFSTRDSIIRPKRIWILKLALPVHFILADNDPTYCVISTILHFQPLEVRPRCIDYRRNIDILNVVLDAYIYRCLSWGLKPFWCQTVAKLFGAPNDQLCEVTNSPVKVKDAIFFCYENLEKNFLFSTLKKTSFII